MKLLIFFIANLWVAVSGTHGQVVYRNDFSGSNVPGFHQSAMFGSIGTWSIVPSLGTANGNQYGQYDITINSEPTSDQTRWYGGYSGMFNTITQMPDDWMLSFRLNVDTLDALRIQIRVYSYLPWTPPFGPSFPEPNETLLSAWVSPQQTGWNTVTMFESDFINEPGELTKFGINSPRINVSLASHDSNSNPQSMSRVGNYRFLLDDIELTAIPEPVTISLMAGATLMILVRRRRY